MTVEETLGRRLESRKVQRAIVKVFYLKFRPLTTRKRGLWVVCRGLEAVERLLTRARFLVGQLS